MEVKGRNVRGIFTKLKVENYSLLFEDPLINQQLQRAKMWRKAENILDAGDAFKPWVPKSTETIMVQLHRRPGCETSEDWNSFTDKPSHESIVAVPKNRFTLTGTSSHTFIQPIDIRYQQLDVVSYFQMMLENIFGYVSQPVLKIGMFEDFFEYF